MRVQRLDHYSIRTTDLDKTIRFYTEVVGFVSGPRPPFEFPGCWLYNGADTFGTSNGVVHVIGVDPNDPQGLIEYLGDKDPGTLVGGGAVDHIAFYCTDLAGLHERATQAGVEFRERTVPSLNIHQVFFEDPSGVTLELNFPAAEAPRAPSA
jgi:catechol 2,3-dioxygenase-like lactoylglutathione lyase family enzyme